MTSRSSRFGEGRSFGAVFLITVGAILLLSHYGFRWNADIWDFWPVILILVGISRLTRYSYRHHPMEGIIWILLGLFLLGGNFDLYHVDSRLIWPLILIAVGVLLLSRRAHTMPASHDGERRSGGNGSLNIFWFLGSQIHRVDSKQFSGGSVVAFLGSGKIDLRNADFEDEAVIDVLSFLDKIHIIVPEGWEISIQGISFLGSMKNNTESIASLESKKKPVSYKRLVIKGLAFLGDVEVLNG